VMLAMSQSVRVRGGGRAWRRLVKRRTRSRAVSLHWRLRERRSLPLAPTTWANQRTRMYKTVIRNKVLAVILMGSDLPHARCATSISFKVMVLLVLIMVHVRRLFSSLTFVDRFNQSINQTNLYLLQQIRHRYFLMESVRLNVET